MNAVSLNYPDRNAPLLLTARQEEGSYGSLAFLVATAT